MVARDTDGERTYGDFQRISSGGPTYLICSALDRTTDCTSCLPARPKSNNSPQLWSLAMAVDEPFNFAQLLDRLKPKDKLPLSARVFRTWITQNPGQLRIINRYAFVLAGRCNSRYRHASTRP